MKIFTIIVAFFSSPDQAEYDKYLAVANKLHPLFTYTSDIEKWGELQHIEVWEGETPISADCEEFAFAAFLQLEKIGAKHVLVYQPNHLITCGDTWCIDNNHKKPFLKP